MTQGLKRVVAAVFLAMLGACGPVVESAEANSPSTASASTPGTGCEAGQARCVGGCKAEHTRCQTQVSVLCAPGAAAVAGCVAHACPSHVPQGCTQDCAEAYETCMGQSR